MGAVCLEMIHDLAAASAMPEASAAIQVAQAELEVAEFYRAASSLPSEVQGSPDFRLALTIAASVVEAVKTYAARLPVDPRAQRDIDAVMASLTRAYDRLKAAVSAGD